MVLPVRNPGGPAYPQLTWESRPKHMTDIRGRVNQFIGGQYGQENLSSLMYAHRLDDEEHVKLEVWSAPGLTKPPFDEAKRQTYKPAKKGDLFGPSWTNHWFRVTIKIPREFEHYERVQLEFDCMGEAMVFTTDGDPIHGLTGAFDVNRRVEFIIPQHARRAGIAHYYIEASCNGMFGQSGDSYGPDDANRYFELASADLVVPNMEAWRLFWDYTALHQLIENLPTDSSLYNKCLATCNQIINTFEQGSLESVAAARKVAEKVLGENWEKEITWDSAYADRQKGELWGVGHCHIDTAWLWPFSVTQQKSARSWSTQLDLMDRYPEHRFNATQAQQYKWVEQLYPSLFRRIKERVADGRFQPIGCTWVEMDTNMPSGEALVRQFLYGQRYYESRFGSRSNTFVLPDTFGYSSQLPQICRLAGADYFFTQKLSWNSINKFPHSTFNWVGIDGSEVMTHMTPVDSYNAQADMGEIRKGTTNHKNLEVTNQALLLFGNGDGGGGPTPPMLEKLRRARAIGKQHDAGGQIPLVKMGGSFEEFYESVRKETDNGKLLPNWRGELYFELHRGTYTSHGSIKKGNRKSEILLREAEYAATLASLAAASYTYPKDRFDASWEDLLLCQFHDVLPGSGISIIYDDAEAKYAALQKRVQAVVDEAHAVLYKSTALTSEKPVEAHGRMFAINTLPGNVRQEVIEVPVDVHAHLRNAADQVSADGKTAFVLVSNKDTHNSIVATKALDAQAATAECLGSDVFQLSNASIRLKIEGGRIVSLVDLALGKELIPAGQTGGMVIMDDHPNNWDAWDVDSFHLEKQHHLKFTGVNVKETGPLRASIQAQVHLGQTTMQVEISLDAVAASLRADARSLVRFRATVDWRETHKFLKFEIPLDIHSDNATYDTQFGVLQRPTHRNTTWDAARFEVCAHKFADLSEFGYGVAVINESKYGYATDGNVMRLSLLRSPKRPDPFCDMGTHHFEWAIYPHVGTYTESDVSDVAFAFNAPMKLRFTSDIDTVAVHPFAQRSPFSIHGARNVILETVKRGENDAFDGKTTIILRVYEQFGGHANAKLRISGLNIVKAELVNLLEDSVETLTLQSTPNYVAQSSETDKEFETGLSFRGFEIKTVRLTLKGSEKKNASQEDGWVKL